MSNYLSETQARRVATTLRLNETRAERRYFSRYNKCNVFLSHKHDEVELVEHIKTILESLSSQVYVDWEDTSMPNHPTGETAEKLKERIRQLDKFIFLASNAAIDSKWCNWEVGYGDAYKLNQGRFAIFPVSNQNGSWFGSEYLQLYPHIEYEPLRYNSLFGDPKYGTYYVINPDGSKLSLANWLAR